MLELTAKQQEYMWFFVDYQIKHGKIYRKRGSQVPPAIKQLVKLGLLVGRTVTESYWSNSGTGRYWDNDLKRYISVDYPDGWLGEINGVYWEVQITPKGDLWLQGKL